MIIVQRNRNKYNCLNTENNIITDINEDFYNKLLKLRSEISYFSERGFITISEYSESDVELNKLIKEYEED